MRKRSVGSKRKVATRLNRRTMIGMIGIAMGWFLIGFLVRGFFLPADLALFQQAQNVIASQYYGEVPSPRQLTYQAIRGMLYNIGDKRAVFYEPIAAQRNGEDAQGKNGATGVIGEMKDGVFELTSVYSGDPAEQAGLQVGDHILSIDGWKIPKNGTQSEVLAMIRGSEGVPVHLVVQRGNHTLTMDPVRKAPQVVSSKRIDSDLAYVRLDGFTENSPEEMGNTLSQLLAQPPQGLIWDLRRNGGGRMEAAQKILDYFLDRGIAFYAQTKDGKLIPYPSKTGDLAEKIPLVVLIGKHTYSAAETCAAAIAERKRGVLMGETSYGKGTINNTIPLLDGSAIQITVAKWLSPVNREWFDSRGVTPEIFFADDSNDPNDPLLQYAVNFLRQLRQETIQKGKEVNTQ